MPIKSYVVFPMEGSKEELHKELILRPACEVIPSTNKDVLVLITDTKSKDEENALMEDINSIPSLQHLSLVSGFKDQMTS